LDTIFIAWAVIASYYVCNPYNSVDISPIFYYGTQRLIVKLVFKDQYSDAIHYIEYLPSSSGQAGDEATKEWPRRFLFLRQLGHERKWDEYVKGSIMIAFRFLQDG
jgi:hypothetical protein